MTQRRLVHLAAALYPLLMVTGFYGSWGLAWIVLGHRPRPSRDDPSEVLGVVYYASGLLPLLMPVAAAIGCYSVVLSWLVHRRLSKILIWSVLLFAPERLAS